MKHDSCIATRGLKFFKCVKCGKHSNNYSNGIDKCEYCCGLKGICQICGELLRPDIIGGAIVMNPNSLDWMKSVYTYDKKNDILNVFFFNAQTHGNCYGDNIDDGIVIMRNREIENIEGLLIYDAAKASKEKRNKIKELGFDINNWEP